jgi:predicted transcriptional regulator
MNQRHPDKRMRTYFEDRETLEVIERIAKAQRTTRSEVIRKATLDYTSRVLSDPDPNKSFLQKVLEGVDPSFLQEALEDDRDKPTLKQTNYTEWADVQEDLQKIKRATRARSLSWVIRCATFEFIQQPQNQLTKYKAHGPNSQPNRRPVRRKRKSPKKN